MLKSYKWMDGWVWKSLWAPLLRAPLCGANNDDINGCGGFAFWEKVPQSQTVERPQLWLWWCNVPFVMWTVSEKLVVYCLFGCLLLHLLQHCTVCEAVLLNLRKQYSVSLFLKQNSFLLFEMFHTCDLSVNNKLHPLCSLLNTDCTLIRHCTGVTLETFTQFHGHQI